MKRFLPVIIIVVLAAIGFGLYTALWSKPSAPFDSAKWQADQPQATGKDTRTLMADSARSKVAVGMKMDDVIKLLGQADTVADAVDPTTKGEVRNGSFVYILDKEGLEGLQVDFDKDSKVFKTDRIKLQ